MRIVRPSEFAMVPTWVIGHAEMRGVTTRIAVYVAVRVLAFEHPNRDWSSERELADDLADISGVSAESCRKHMRAMRVVGIIVGDAGEIILPSDPPGAVAPHNGATQTQSGAVAPHAPLTKKEREETDAQFDHFWSLYPKKEGKKNARLAFKRALMTNTDFDAIMAGLAKRVEWWKAAGTTKQHMKDASGWLNGERWNDELNPLGIHAAVSGMPDEVAEWLIAKYGEQWFFGFGPSVHDAWRVGAMMKYGPGELAVRVAVQCRIATKAFDSNVETSAYVLVNVKGVSRFSGGLPTYLGAPKTYAELMDLAHKQGTWLVRP